LVEAFQALRRRNRRWPVPRQRGCADNGEAELVRYFFDALFVQTIIQLINAEDEVWMVESGMKNRVHIWRVPGGNDDGNDLL